MKNSVIIIGSTGFLGKQLKAKLQLLDFKIVDLYRMPSIYDVWDENLKNEKCSYIFHCANVFTPGISENKIKDAKRNKEINEKVIWFWQKYQPQAKLISFGSDAAYDDIEKKIEKDYLNGEPIEDYKDYAFTKRQLFHNLNELYLTNALNFYHFVLITLYGPYFKMEDEHLIHSIVKKIYAAKNDSKYIAEFWGDGKQIREITYIDDVIDNMLNIIFSNEMKFMNRPVNLGSNISYPIEVLVEEVCKLMNYSFSNVVFNKEKHSGVKKKSLNSSFASTNLSDYKTTTLREGLKKTIDYYCLKQSLLK